MAEYIRFKHYTALTFLVATPIILALPPRRLNKISALLTGAFCASANHLLHENTGRGIGDRVSEGFSSVFGGSAGAQGLPTQRAEEVQAKLRAARDARIRAAEEERDGQGVVVSKEELEKLKARREMDRGIMEKLWMAGETEGWKERRIEEERKALEEGKGYGDLIKGYFSDAWSWVRPGRDGDGSGSKE